MPDNVPSPFSSLDEFLYLNKTGLGSPDMSVKTAASKKFRLGIKAANIGDGVAQLKDIAKNVMGESLPKLFEKEVDRKDLIDELVYVAFNADLQVKLKAKNTIRTFLESVGLLDEVAKKPEPVKTAQPPAEMREYPPLDDAVSDLDPPFEVGIAKPEESPKAENQEKFPEIKYENQSDYVNSATPKEPGVSKKRFLNAPIVAHVDTVPEIENDPLGDFTNKGLHYVWPGNGGNGMSRIASGELMKLPGILPPPPKGGEGKDFGSWLDGDVWNTLAFNIKLDIRDDDNIDDLIEMQSEFFAEPAGAIKTYSARNAADPEEGRPDAEFLHRAGRDLGQYSFTVQRASEELSKAVLRYFEEHEPRSAEFLGRVGFQTICTEKLAMVVASALDIEKFFMDNGPEGAGTGDIHDTRGAISPDSRLDVPHALDRAVLMHFSIGTPLAKGMKDTLVELRHAQVSRYAGKFIVANEFDEEFSKDWFIDLNEYEVAREEQPSPM